jgi:hypothetical protein
MARNVFVEICKHVRIQPKEVTFSGFTVYLHKVTFPHRHLHGLHTSANRQAVSYLRHDIIVHLDYGTET